MDWYKHWRQKRGLALATAGCASLGQFFSAPLGYLSSFCDTLKDLLFRKNPVLINVLMNFFFLRSYMKTSILCAPDSNISVWTPEMRIATCLGSQPFQGWALVSGCFRNAPHPTNPSLSHVLSLFQVPPIRSLCLSSLGNFICNKSKKFCSSLPCYIC